MYYLALLFLVVVGASAAPGKTVLSMALDLLPDLQAVFASGPPVEGVDQGNIDGVTRAFTVFIPIVKQVLQAEADQEKRKVDSQTIDTLERVQRLVPGVINLIGAVSSGAPLGIDLEFPLPDFTGVIQRDAEAGDAPPVSNDILTEAGATGSAQPVPTYAVPQVPPTYAAPQVPTYVAPKVLTYAAPQVPTDVAAQVSALPDSATYNVPSVPQPLLSPASGPSLVNLQAPAAVLPVQFDYDAALNAVKERGTQQSRGAPSDDTVRYVLPGGGFFYSTGY